MNKARQTERAIWLACAADAQAEADRAETKAERDSWTDAIEAAKYEANRQ